MMVCFFSDSSSSLVTISRLLQILREFSTDPILITYVIDDVWEYMNAMKVSSRNPLNVGLLKFVNVQILLKSSTLPVATYISLLCTG